MRKAFRKEEFYAQVRAQTHQTPEVEPRLRKEVVRLKEALAASRAAAAASRQRAEQIALAAAALPLQPPERPASEVDTDVLAFGRHPR
ncbi:hypothetical protein [Streptomyces sp. NPDC001068]|uniref:hypothetical protein n=1 Tax=Streptomyces sp. NPDC001068 TaxID=3364544 RepID=UPI0036B632CC